MAEEKAWFL